MWRARWSEREKQRLHTTHWKGFAPVCFLKWRVSSSERAKRHSHPSHEHWYGFSPSTDKKKKQIFIFFRSQRSFDNGDSFFFDACASTVRHKSVCLICLSALLMKAAGFMFVDNSGMGARSVSKHNVYACQTHSSACQHIFIPYKKKTTQKQLFRFVCFYLCGSVDELLNETTWCTLSCTLKKKEFKYICEF